MDEIKIPVTFEDGEAAATVKQLRDYLDQMRDSVTQSAEAISAENMELAQMR